MNNFLIGKQGDFLTYNVLLCDSEKLVQHSNIHQAKDELFPNANRWQPPANSNVSTHHSQPIVHSISNFCEEPIDLPIFSPEELLGMTFLCQHDGKDFLAKVICKVLDCDAHDDQEIKFHSLSDSALEEIITTPHFGFSQISDHQGPLNKDDPHYKGSSLNVYVNWDDGTCTWEPHAEIAKFDPVMAALFDHNQAFSKTKCFMMLLMLPNPVQIGVKIPHTYSKAVKFDAENGNTLWQDATALELSQLCDYHCFSDVGPHTTLPPDHHQISVQFVYDVKEDGHHKGHLVALGDFTPEPEEAVYPGVASLCSLWFVTFLADLNQQHLMQGNIGNAYLESFLP